MSLSVMIPTNLSHSITGNVLMWCLSIKLAASTKCARGAIVIGFKDITLLIGQFASISLARVESMAYAVNGIFCRKSSMVTMPTKIPSSTTNNLRISFSTIFQYASGMVRVLDTVMGSGVIHSLTIYSFISTSS